MWPGSHGVLRGSIDFRLMSCGNRDGLSTLLFPTGVIPPSRQPATQWITFSLIRTFTSFEAKCHSLTQLLMPVNVVHERACCNLPSLTDPSSGFPSSLGRRHKPLSRSRPPALFGAETDARRKFQTSTSTKTALSRRPHISGDHSYLYHEHVADE